MALLIALAACTGSADPPGSEDTTASTGIPTTGAATSASRNAACDLMEGLEAEFAEPSPDYGQIIGMADYLTTLAANLMRDERVPLMAIGRDSAAAARAFRAGDADKGSTLRDRALEAIPATHAAMHCDLLS